MAKDAEKRSDNISSISSITAAQNPVDLTVSDQFDYGVTPDYKRQNYDSQAARENFHKSQFGNKKTTISSDGKVVHKSHKAAENKYGKKHASSHQAEADHRDPLKNIHERVENDPIKRSLLTDEDIKEIGNRNSNYQELSKQENASKGAQSEIQRGIETHDLKRTVKGVQTQAETDVLLTCRAAKNAAVAVGTITANAVGDGIQAGKDAALITLTVSGLNNLACVAKGEKDLGDALEDVAKTAADSFINGAGVRMAQDVVVSIANTCGAEPLANFVANGIPAAEIAMATMTINTVKQYLDGKLSAEDCVCNILKQGAGTLAYQMGFAIGGPAGAIIASVVVTQISTAITEYRQEQKIQKARAAELDHLLSCAKAEIAQQHDYLRDYVQKELGRWDDAIDDGFKQIISSAVDNNNNGIVMGLNTILGLFGSRAYYQSVDEYKRDFLSESSVLNL